MENKMKNVLLIVPFLPYPLLSGGHQAVFSEIRALRQKYKVFVVYRTVNYNPNEESKFYEVCPDVTLCHYCIKKKKFGERVANLLIRKIEHFFLRSDSNVEYKKEFAPTSSFVDDVFAQFVNDVIKKEKIDVVINEFVSALALVVCLPPNIRKIFVHHEIRFARLKEFLESKQLISSSNQAKYVSLKCEEIGFLNMYDSIVTFSHVDTEKLRANGVVSPIVTSFFSVESSSLPYQHCKQKNVLSFVGPEMHKPNYFGLQSFLAQCWIDLTKEYNDLELHIIGMWSREAREFIEKKYARVRFLGYVDDLNNALAGSLMIVPIDMGSGIRTKILDAAYMSVPILTTKIGIEGIPLVNGEECIMVNSISEMSDVIRDVIGNDEKRETLARNAYEKIKKCYSDENLLKTRSFAIDGKI